MNTTAPLPSLVESLGWDDRRGTRGVVLFILTEAMLFVSLFFAYFWLGRDEPRWLVHEPPKMTLALVMLAVLLLSSGVIEWARRRAKMGQPGLARAGTWVTTGMGTGFLVLQAFEYRNHLKTLTPTTDAYGSIFYTITTIHGAHLALGVLMLGYVALLPKLAPTHKPPHRPLHNASLYWHFIDGVWVFIVVLLYILPNLYR